MHSLVFQGASLMPMPTSSSCTACLRYAVYLTQAFQILAAT